MTTLTIGQTVKMVVRSGDEPMTLTGTVIEVTPGGRRVYVRLPDATVQVWNARFVEVA